MQHVRTKWHKILPLLTKGKAVLSGKAFVPFPDNVDLKKLVGFLAIAETFPHFVIDPELSGLSGKMEYQHSLLDMKRAGVLRLPYPAMVVEYTPPDSDTWPRQHICILRDLHHEGVLPWESAEVANFREQKSHVDMYGIRMTVDAASDCLTISPSILFLGIQDGPKEEDEVKNSAYVDYDGAWVSICGYNSGLILKYNTESQRIIDEGHIYDAGPVFHAAASALLLMSTAGVKKEVIETDKINRKRDGVVKPFIPRHTYIRIGHVYASATSSKSTEYVPHKSPRPHWRRGHIRIQRTGKGWTSSHQVYIKPRLVAYHGDLEPTKPDYVVID